MNTPDEMIAVIQAEMDGKPVQYRHSGCQWEDKTESESWAFDIREFRIKPTPPKPREWWIGLHDYAVRATGGSYACITKWEGSNPPTGCDSSNMVHVREVLS